MAGSQRRQIRFGLRFLLVAMTVAAIVAANWLLVLYYMGQYFLLFAPLIAIGSFCLVRWMQAEEQPGSAPQRNGWSGYLFLALAGLLLAVTIFVRHRWLVNFEDPLWPRQYPYPDCFLDDLHNWWDRLHPPPPGSFKIHGEYYSVLLFLDAIAISASAVFGTAAGCLRRRVQELAKRHG